MIACLWLMNCFQWFLKRGSSFITCCKEETGQTQALQEMQWSHEEKQAVTPEFRWPFFWTSPVHDYCSEVFVREYMKIANICYCLERAEKIHIHVAATVDNWNIFSHQWQKLLRLK